MNRNNSLVEIFIVDEERKDAINNKTRQVKHTHKAVNDKDDEKRTIELIVSP